jgi:hypothetical protein
MEQDLGLEKPESMSPSFGLIAFLVICMPIKFATNAYEGNSLET